MSDQLHSLTQILAEADDKLRSGLGAGATVLPTGFAALDQALTGGLRAGELVLLAGPQGLGKTTLALQVLRNAAVSGRSAVYLSFEHDSQSVLQRLVTMEIEQTDGFTAPRPVVDLVRRAFDGADGSTRSLMEGLAQVPGGAAALEAVRSYSDRLHVHRSSGAHTSIATVRSIVEQVRLETGQLPLVVVDYLQKLRVQGLPTSEEERVTAITEGLKDMALDLELPVLSIVASDKEGIGAGKRMRVQHLRGSSALAYEADVVLIMNEKFDVVARHHLVYDLGNAERFRDWVILSIEKNRSGRDKIDLEFRKRFDQGRFETTGSEVTEQLVDERVFVE